MSLQAVTCEQSIRGCLLCNARHMSPVKSLGYTDLLVLIKFSTCVLLTFPVEPVTADDMALTSPATIKAAAASAMTGSHKEG